MNSLYDKNPQGSLLPLTFLQELIITHKRNYWRCGSAIIARNTRLDFAKHCLIFLDIVLKGKHKLLHILRSHDYAALHLRLRCVWRQTYHIEEKFCRTV